MDFYQINAGQGKQFYEGEFSPYPRDLGELILTPGPVPQNICVKVVRGGRLGDRMFAAFGVVSRNFVDVLQACEATGYAACPIRAFAAHRANENIPGCFLLKLLGRGGHLDLERSYRDPRDREIESRYPNLRGSKRYIGIYMNDAEWDGSDVFAIPELGIAMFVVERVAQAIRKAKLRNVRLTKNTEACIYV